MLITRIPLMEVIAAEGTLVLKIFLVFRVREKHRNTSQNVAIMESFKIKDLFFKPVWMVGIFCTWVYTAKNHHSDLGGTRTRDLWMTSSTL